MNITTHLISNNWMKIPDIGLFNGYIGVPPEHPWFGKHYDDLENIDIHGGLTYSGDHLPKEKPDGNWYFGFDTMHSGDNPQDCDEFYCQKEVENLKLQALQRV